MFRDGHQWTRSMGSRQTVKKNTKNWYTIDALGAIFAIFTILDTFTILLQYFYKTIIILLKYFYNTFTILLQYFYNTITILLPYFYNTFTILLQY